MGVQGGCDSGVMVGVGVSVGVAVSVAVGVAVSVAVSVGVGVSVGVSVGVGVAVSVGVSVGVAVSVGVSVGVAVAVSVGVSVGVAVGAMSATNASRQPAPASTSSGLQLTSWNASASAIRARNSVRSLVPAPVTVNGTVASTTSPSGPATPIEQAMKASPVAGLPSALGSASDRSPLAGVALQSKPGRALVGVPAVSHEAS